MKMNELCELVREVVSPVYLVGGCVRDSLMGATPTDYDFATPLSPDEVEAAVRAAGKRPYVTGKRFGTIGFKVEGYKVEVTTFRNEKYVKGSRKPVVEYVDDITADLSRRDFTMNAIAMTPYKTIDPHNGFEDILDGVIRAVGNPRTRFKEDPLRMLRAARFAAQLGFDIELNTVGAMARYSHRILDVSRERWMSELDKLLLTEKPSEGLRYLASTGLLTWMIPELMEQVGYEQNSSYHSLQLWNHTLGVVDGVPADIHLRWAALLHDIGKPRVRTEKPGRSIYVKHELLGAELVERLALYLKWSNERRGIVKALVLNHLDPDSPLKEADDAAKREVA